MVRATCSCVRLTSDIAREAERQHAAEMKRNDADAGGVHGPAHGSKRASEPAASEPMGFIQKAKAHGANSLLGAYVSLHERFDYAFRGMEIVRIDDGFVRCTITVTDGLLNSYGTLHGGALCTIVDIVGTLALLSKDASKAGVSVELNTSFVAAAKRGEALFLEGRVLKMGKRLGFTEVDVLRQSDGVLIATGRHTKAL